MPFFVVKRDLPGVTPEALQSAGIRAKSCCAEMTGEGQPVRWVRSFYLPETAQAHCYFEAASKSSFGRPLVFRRAPLCILWYSFTAP
jgi:hypothetical protein